MTRKSRKLPRTKPRALGAPRAFRSLGSYRAKRRFDVTPEPHGEKRRAAAKALRFVIQKHAARQLHYDFRLELGGTLLSWAVPKGPSVSPGTRRLAVRTEDHPLEYAEFEGEIPKGEYGGGSVEIWDRGRWIPESDPNAQLEAGRLSFTLEGERLRGRWHLVRTRAGAANGARESWLLMKARESAASDADASARERARAGARVARRLPAGSRGRASRRPDEGS